MRAMILDRQRQPLKPATLPDPEPGPGQLLLEVHACGVCRTDLHLRDAEIAATKLPIVLGHQIVATTTDGRRVGVPWLGWTDGTCRYCTSSRENLCVGARFTGRDIDGATRSSRLPTSGSAWRFPMSCRTTRPRRSCAAGSSAIAH